MLTPAQEAAFFAACSAWQRPIFQMLAAYGLRVGELVHLLVEDVDFEGGVVYVRGKPELCWGVKTRSARRLPLTPETEAVFRAVVGTRRSGFAFLNDGVACDPAAAFASDRAMKAQARETADETAPADGSDASERARRKAVTAFCRRLGMIPEKRARLEFMKLTAAIGCPHLTRVHDLRHLFATLAQERGLNPLVVQRLLGHKSLAMTDRYSQFGPEALREAVSKLSGTPTSEGRRDGE